MDMDMDMEVRSSPPTQLLDGARDGVREQDTHLFIYAAIMVKLPRGDHHLPRLMRNRGLLMDLRNSERIFPLTVGFTVRFCTVYNP